MPYDDMGQCPDIRSRLLTLVDCVCLYPPAARIDAGGVKRRTSLDPRDVRVCNDLVLVRGCIDMGIPYRGMDGNHYHRRVTLPVEACVRVPGIRPGDGVDADLSAKCGTLDLADDGRSVRLTVCTEVVVSTKGKCMYGW